MHTKADDHLDRAKAALNTSIKELAELVVGQCDGWDEFSDEYKEELTETLGKLITIRNHVLPPDCE